MKFNELDSMSKAAVVIAAIAFLLSMTVTILKYTQTGEFAFTSFFGGIVIPGVIVTLIMSRSTKS